MKQFERFFASWDSIRFVGPLPYQENRNIVVDIAIISSFPQHLSLPESRLYRIVF